MAFVVVILPCSLALQVQGQCHGCPSWTRGSRLSLSHHRQSLERSHLETEIKHLEKLQKVSKHLRNIRPRPSMPVLPRLRQKHLQGNASFWTHDVYDVSEDYFLSNCTTLHDEVWRKTNRNFSTGSLVVSIAFLAFSTIMDSLRSPAVFGRDIVRGKRFSGATISGNSLSRHLLKTQHFSNDENLNSIRYELKQHNGSQFTTRKRPIRMGISRKAFDQPPVLSNRYFEALKSRKWL